MQVHVLNVLCSVQKKLYGNPQNKRKHLQTHINEDLVSKIYKGRLQLNNKKTTQVLKWTEDLGSVVVFGFFVCFETMSHYIARLVLQPSCLHLPSAGIMVCITMPSLHTGFELIFLQRKIYKCPINT